MQSTSRGFCWLLWSYVRYSSQNVKKSMQNPCGSNHQTLVVVPKMLKIETAYRVLRTGIETAYREREREKGRTFALGRRCRPRARGRCSLRSHTPSHAGLSWAPPRGGRSRLRRAPPSAASEACLVSISFGVVSRPFPRFFPRFPSRRSAPRSMGRVPFRFSLRRCPRGSRAAPPTLSRVAARGSPHGSPLRDFPYSRPSAPARWPAARVPSPIAALPAAALAAAAVGRRSSRRRLGLRQSRAPRARPSGAYTRRGPTR